MPHLRGRHLRVYSMTPWDDLRVIDRMAWRAAWSAFDSWLAVSERHDVAMGALAEGIARASREGRNADPLELHQAAVAAISAESLASRRDHGLSAPLGFARYWLDDQPAMGRPDDEVPPRIALKQCFGALPERHREALLLLALHGSTSAAADAARVGYSTMNGRVHAARVAFYALWFDGEQPPKPPFDRRSSALPTHCGNGHEFTPENTRWRKATSGRGKKRACRSCDAAAESRRRERAA